jgi:NAD-dependent SIR2 family protein deacetylase
VTSYFFNAFVFFWFYLQWTLEEKKKKLLDREKNRTKKNSRKAATIKKKTISSTSSLQISDDDGIYLSPHTNSKNDNKEENSTISEETQNNTKRCRQQSNGTVVPALPRMTFEAAQPTYTHRAVTKLINHGIAHFCVTQNVDGLHRKSGLDRCKLAILHGCVFTEKCETCHREYFRNFDVGTISFQRTGRTCTVCSKDSGGGFLRDTLLDWEDELPEEDFQLATRHCSKENCMVICLGTSLRIEPAASLPLLAQNGYVVVNMQVTPKDCGAKLVIRARVDDVMKDMMQRFGLDEEDITYEPQQED